MASQSLSRHYGTMWWMMSKRLIMKVWVPGTMPPVPTPTSLYSFVKILFAKSNFAIDSQNISSLQYLIHIYINISIQICKTHVSYIISWWITSNQFENLHSSNGIMLVSVILYSVYYKYICKTNPTSSKNSRCAMYYWLVYRKYVRVKCSLNYGSAIASCMFIVKSNQKAFVLNSVQDFNT